MGRSLVIEADGGSRGNPGPAGYGAVVLDPQTGETLAEAAEYIGVATNNVAEYKGLIAGLRAAHALAPDATVHVRMDSKLVVEQMSGRWKIKHPDMKPLAAEAATVFPRVRVTYEWIPREKNKHADRLANEAMDAGKKGKKWEPSASTADLVSGPPRVVGDAVAGAAKARAALGRAVAEPLTLPDASEAEPVAAPTVGWGASADLGTPATLVLLRHGETALTPRSGSPEAAVRTPGCRRSAAARPRRSPPPWPRAAPSRRSSAPRSGAAARRRTRWRRGSAWTYASRRACARRTSGRGRA